MYLLKKEFIDLFKEIRTKVYAESLGCDAGFMSSVLNGNKICSEMVAKAMINVRFEVHFKSEEMTQLLTKYFAKEK